MKRRQCIAWLAGAPTLIGARGAAAAEAIRIGQTLPLSGHFGPVIASIREGQDALFDEVNRQGGVHGARIELILLDDASDDQKALENCGTLIKRDKVLALFGVAMAEADGILPLLNQTRTPLIGLYNGADNLRHGHQPMLFTTTASYNDELRQMVQTLSSTGVRQIAVAHLDSALGLTAAQMVDALAQEKGMRIVARERLDRSGANAAAVAQAVARLKPEAILLLAAGPAVFGYVKAADSMARTPIYVPSTASAGSALKLLGESARGMVVTQVVPYPWRQTTLLTRSFGAAMRRLKLPVSYERFWGYLNASVLVEALRRAGPSPSSGSLVAALEGMRDIDIGGYRLRFGPDNHHGSHFVDITMLDERGEFVR